MYNTGCTWEDFSLNRHFITTYGIHYMSRPYLLIVILNYNRCQFYVSKQLNHLILKTCHFLIH